MDDDKVKTSRLLKEIPEIEDMSEVLEYTHHDDPAVRRKAVQQLCPCRVKKDFDEFWKRTMELAKDEDPVVRMQVLHNMCDGSPAHMEEQVAEALDLFNNDPDKEIRRKAHKVMASYMRTGKWNIL